MLAVKELRLQRKHTRRDILGAQGIVNTGADPRDRETKSINFYWEIVGKKQKTFLKR